MPTTTNCPQTSAKKSYKPPAQSLGLKGPGAGLKNETYLSLALKCHGLLGADILFGGKAQDELCASASKRLQTSLLCAFKELASDRGANPKEKPAFQYKVSKQGDLLLLSLVTHKTLLDEDRLQALIDSLMAALKKPIKMPGQALMLETDPRIGYHVGQELAFDKAAFALARTSIHSPVQKYDLRHRRLRLARMKRETEIRDGLRRGEFVSYFQPKVDPRNNQVVGGEALVRWKHPEKGLLMPKDFLGIAEESSLICDISQTVARQTVALLVRLKRKAKEVPIAINLSEQDLKVPDLIEQTSRQLEKYNLSPDLINLEVSERVALINEEDLSDFMSAVQKAGFSLALDDFGTAYSGLLRLLQLPISEIKVDRLFLVKAAESPKGRSILQGLVSMLLEHKYRVTVEGVEKLRELNLLKAMPGCFAQGFYFSPAVDAQQFQGLKV